MLLIFKRKCIIWSNFLISFFIISTKRIVYHINKVLFLDGSSVVFVFQLIKREL